MKMKTDERLFLKNSIKLLLASWATIKAIIIVVLVRLL